MKIFICKVNCKVSTDWGLIVTYIVVAETAEAALALAKEEEAKEAMCGQDTWEVTYSITEVTENFISCIQVEET